MPRIKRRDLEDISQELVRGLELLMSSKFEIMVPRNLLSRDVFTAPYYPGEHYMKITKQYGNELVPMFSAIRRLSKLLKAEKEEVKA